jgi:hypothetical protein
MESCVKNRLFKSLCISLCGSELWLLASDGFINYVLLGENACAGHGIDLSHNTHCDILPLICNSLPGLDKVCKRCLDFLHSCINSEFEFVRFTILHGTKFGRSLSPTRHTTLFCITRYRSFFDPFADFRKSIVTEHIQSTVNDDMRKVDFLEESLSYRDALFRPHTSGCLLSRYEAADIISFLCTD